MSNIIKQALNNLKLIKECEEIKALRKIKDLKEECEYLKELNETLKLKEGKRDEELHEARKALLEKVVITIEFILQNFILFDLLIEVNI